MKKLLWEIGAILLIVLTVTGSRLYYKYKEYKSLYDIELQNVRAYQVRNDSLSSSNRQFIYTIDALKYSYDSIDQKLIAATKELKIKDKNIKQLQYQKNVITKSDTIKIKGDTIFRNIEPIDTTVGDKWYNLNLQLRYPSTIVVNPTFTSEQYVVTHAKKEYVNKPSKWFFIRWFQKKHTVIEIEVLEKNPYITNKEFKQVQVVK